MNIYMVSESPRVVAQCVPDDVWERRLFDAVELVSEGAAHWEGEESMFICHDTKHSWVSWVNEYRQNWIWSLGYLHHLVDELTGRRKNIDERILSYADFIWGEYGMSAMIASAPPRCVPKTFKLEEKTIKNTVMAYRRYIAFTFGLHETDITKASKLHTNLDP